MLGSCAPGGLELLRQEVLADSTTEVCNGGG